MNINDAWRYGRSGLALGLGLLGLACSESTEDSETTAETSSDTAGGSSEASAETSSATATGSTTATGSNTGSTGDAATGTSGTGGPADPCPENPHADCAIDCSIEGVECGTETSTFDARGCPRDACYADGDCESGQRCFGIGTGDPEFCIPPTTCLPGEEVRCSCGTAGACYPGYCVPR